MDDTKFSINGPQRKQFRPPVAVQKPPTCPPVRWPVQFDGRPIESNGKATSTSHKSDANSRNGKDTNLFWAERRTKERKRKDLNHELPLAAPISPHFVHQQRSQSGRPLRTRTNERAMLDSESGSFVLLPTLPLLLFVTAAPVLFVCKNAPRTALVRQKVRLIVRADNSLRFTHSRLLKPIDRPRRSAPVQRRSHSLTNSSRPNGRRRNRRRKRSRNEWTAASRSGPRSDNRRRPSIRKPPSTRPPTRCRCRRPFTSRPPPTVDSRRPSCRRPPCRRTRVESPPSTPKRR